MKTIEIEELTLEIDEEEFRKKEISEPWEAFVTGKAKPSVNVNLPDVVVEFIRQRVRVIPRKRQVLINSSVTTEIKNLPTRMPTIEYCDYEYLPDMVSTILEDIIFSKK